MKRTLCIRIALLLLISATAHAGHHSAASAALRLDALPPQVTLISAPEGQVFTAGDTLHFVWRASDAYPALHDSSRTASVLVREEPFDVWTCSGDTLQTWSRPAPEASSPDCRLSISVKDAFGNETLVRSDTFRLWRSDTSAPTAPSGFRLNPPAPNPFNPSTRVSFTLDAAGTADLSVYDLQGRRVRRLLNGPLPAGEHVLTWNGRDDAGRRAPGGFYLVRLTTPGLAPVSRKVVLLP